uniref:Uncharacterized protein n=1 Tax=Arundo donax TaxID=35708 RepID=A0A0A9GWU4_ARUDO
MKHSYPIQPRISHTSHSIQLPNLIVSTD